MTKHVLDRFDRTGPEAPLGRYARAARGLDEERAGQAELRLRRRAKGTYDPSARVRAFLRIDRGRTA